MRRATAVRLTANQRRELRRALRRGGPGRRVARRLSIVLEAASGRTNAEIAHRLHVTPETAARWRRRYLSAGLEGLRREAPRAGARARVPRELVERIVRATLDRSGPGAPEWTTRSLARELGTNHMAVHRTWHAFGLRSPPSPRRRSARATRVDLVGVYRESGTAAVVFGLAGPARPLSARATSLPAAPAPPNGEAAAAAHRLGSSLRRTDADPPRPTIDLGRPTSLLVFLRSIERETPSTLRLEAIVDRPLEDLGSRVGAWLESHPRYRVFTAPDADAWVRSAEAWLRRWELVPLDPRSFRDLAAFHATTRDGGPAGPRAPESVSWRPPGSRRSSRGPAASRRGPPGTDK